MAEEPPSKKQTLDFSLCLKCQKPGPLVEQHLGLPTYERVLDSVRKRSEYGNPDFVQLSQQLHGLSAQDLEENHASWHRSCYGEITHKQHTERDKARWKRALADKDSSVLFSRIAGRPASVPSVSQDTPSLSAGRVTRSSIQAFNRDHCFYCQEVKYEGKKKELHECSTSNIGKSIQEVVDASDNEVWKVHLVDIIAEGDFLSRDIKYHKSCHTTNWRRYVQKPRKVSTDADELNRVEFISAEIEFFAELQECLEDGEILTVNKSVQENDARSWYRRKMSSLQGSCEQDPREPARCHRYTRNRETTNTYKFQENSPVSFRSCSRGQRCCSRHEAHLPVLKDHQANNHPVQEKKPVVLRWVNHR